MHVLTKMEITRRNLRVYCCCNLIEDFIESFEMMFQIKLGCDYPCAFALSFRWTSTSCRHWTMAPARPSAVGGSPNAR